MRQGIYNGYLQNDFDGNVKVISGLGGITVPGSGQGKNIYIAIRTDGKAGSGSELDPLDGSTQAKFDAIMVARYNANLTGLHFHLGIGTFQAKVAPANLWYPLDGWTIEGAGEELTFIQAAPGVWYNGVHYGVSVLTNDPATPKTGIAIKNLTVDANFPGVAEYCDDGVGGARVLADAKIVSGSAIVSSATGAFRWNDLFKHVSATGIPAGARLERIPATGITSGSNEVAMSGTFAVNVISTEDFKPSGTILVESSAGKFQVITYTGTTATSFTGCTGGTGTMRTGGSVSTDTQMVLSAAATATNAALTMNISGEKRINLNAIGLKGRNITYENVRSINTYGSKANSNGPYGAEVAFEMFAISIGAGNDALQVASYNNRIRKCRAEQPYGSYGNGITGGGSSKVNPMTDFSITGCNVIGINDGLGTSGFQNSAYSVSFAKGYKVTDNEATDVGAFFYVDTGSIEDFALQRNRIVRCGVGPYITQAGDATWTNSNLSITDNYIELQNRYIGGDAVNGFRFTSPNDCENFDVSRNTIVYRATGRGSDNGHGILAQNIDGLKIYDNTFDTPGLVFQIDPSCTGVEMSRNRDPIGGVLTGLEDIEAGSANFSAIGSGALNSVSQVIPNGALTQVLFNTEQWDVTASYAASTFTAPLTGYYRFNVGVTEDTNAALSILVLYKNGVRFYPNLKQTNNTAQYNVISGEIVMALTAADTIKVYLYQNSGGDLNIYVNSQQSYFQGVKL